MFNIQTEKERILREEAELKARQRDEMIKHLDVIRAKSIEVLKAKNRNMVKMQVSLDEGYKDAIIEMARDYQVSTSVIIRVACQYFHGLCDLTDKVTLGSTPRLGELTDHDPWRPVIWVQKDLKDQLEKDSLESGMTYSRFVRAAVTVMYDDYTVASMKDASEFEKTIADLIWEDKHSYEIR